MDIHYIITVIFVSSLVGSSNQEDILLANGDEILKMDTSNWSRADRVTRNDDHLIYTLDWHSGTGDIYWSDQIPQDEELRDVGDMGIYVYQEESGTVSSITHGINVPALAVDWVHNNLYFSNRASHTISVYSLNTHYSHEIYSGEGAAELESIVLDPRDDQRYMYIADGQDASSITRCGLDGGNCTKVMETDAGSPRYPHGLTIDFQDNKLYWVDDFNEHIIRTALEPPFQEELVFNVNDNTAVIWGMDILAIHNSIYYTDTANNALHHLRCDPNCDVNETPLIGGDLQHPTALKTMHESRQPAGTNTCGSADCALCLPRGNDVVTSQLPYQCHGGDTRTDVTSISPAHGSIEGGTPLVIKIREQDRPYISAGETYTICLGNDCENLLCRFEGLLDAAMYACVTSPLPADQSSLIGTPQPLFLFWEGHPKPKPLRSDITYAYQEHPTVTDIYPREIIVSGGTTITVEGTNLDVIVSSVLVMHVEVLSQLELNRNIRVDCGLVTTANSSIQLHCLAPMLDFLSKQINETVTQCENSGRYGCYERIIEIYLGMIFDNSTILEDLRHHSDSEVVKLSKIKAIFKDPEIASVGKHEVKTYWPNSVGSIKIPVTNLNIGTLQNQFTVTFSGHPLKTENVEFLDDAIECDIPKEEPELLDGQEMHPLVISIGSLTVEAAQVKYTTSIFSCVPCTAGIFGGVASVIIIIVIITALCCVIKISRASDAEKDTGTETTGLGKRRNVEPPPIDLRDISSTSANSSNSTVPPMTPHRNTPPVTPHPNTPPVMPYPNTPPPIISHPNTPPIMRHPSTLPTRPLPNTPPVMPHPNELSARSHPNTPPPMMPHPNTPLSSPPAPPEMQSPRNEDDEGGSGYLKPGGANSVYQTGGYLHMGQGHEDGYLQLQDNQQTDYVEPQDEMTYQNGTFHRANRDTISASGVIMGSHDQLPGGSHEFAGIVSYTQWDAYTGNGHHDPTSQHHQNVQHYLRNGDAAY